MDNKGAAANLETMGAIVAGTLLLVGVFAGPPVLKAVCLLTFVLGGYLYWQAKQG
jgi:hypothetical protein